MCLLEDIRVKDIKEITFMLRTSNDLPLPKDHHNYFLCNMFHKGNEGDIFTERDKSKIHNARSFTHGFICYYMNFKLENNSERFIRSNGRNWEECNSEKESYKYVPERFSGRWHRWKSKLRQLHFYPFCININFFSVNINF